MRFFILIWVLSDLVCVIEMEVATIVFLRVSVCVMVVSVRGKLIWITRCFLYKTELMLE